MSEAYGLYSHIQTNRYRSAILIAGLFLLVYLLVFAFTLAFNGFAIGDEPLDVILESTWTQFLWLLAPATLVTGLWVTVGYRFHQGMIDRSTGAKDVTREEEPRLYNLLENLCISRGIPAPKLQIVETDVMNAYASGMNDKQYRIAVTRAQWNITPRRCGIVSDVMVCSKLRCCKLKAPAEMMIAPGDGQQKESHPA